jgi:hypothetical protein
MTDLWPVDLAVVTKTSPLAILKEQASLLGQKTKNIVVGKVELSRMAEFVGSRGFTYDFIIVGPALDNYAYRLFAVEYDVDLYPVRFRLDSAIAEELGLPPKEFLIAPDETNFKVALSRVLGSQKSRNVVQAILSQSLGLSSGNGDTPIQE